MDESVLEGLPPEFRRHLSIEDFEENSTLQSFDAIVPHLELLLGQADSIDTILDVGCGSGGFTRGLADYLEASEVFGIESKPSLRRSANEAGIETFDVDAEVDRYPIGTESVDLVVCFGLIEHFRYYDHLFSEVSRVLDGGWLWIATPNLGSWINRIALLTGYQPRNVEISSERSVGVLPVYDRSEFLDHVHAPTYKALIEILELYRFEPVSTAKLTPYQRGTLVRYLDRIFGIRTGLSRRIAVLATSS